MQIGCSLMGMEEISLAGQIGFDYIELTGKYLVSLDEKDFGKLAGILDRHHLECMGINGYCPADIVIAGPGFEIKRAKQYAKRVALRAKELGTSYAGIGSPNSRMLPQGYSRELARIQVMDFLKATAEEMGKYGITVCLEALAPCYCNFINHVTEAAELTREIGWESIRTVLDFYNMEYTGEADLDLSPWMKELVHGHISDDAGSPRKRYFLNPKKKEIHQRRLRGLKNSGYGGAISIEVDLPLDAGRGAESLKILRDAI